MSSPSLEAFLARLYTDGVLRARFQADAIGAGASFGLTGPELAAVCAIDVEALELAAASYAKKRNARCESHARRADSGES